VQWEGEGRRRGVEVVNIPVRLEEAEVEWDGMERKVEGWRGLRWGLRWGVRWGVREGLSGRIEEWWRHTLHVDRTTIAATATATDTHTWNIHHRRRHHLRMEMGVQPLDNAPVTCLESALISDEEGEKCLIGRCRERGLVLAKYSGHHRLNGDVDVMEDGVTWAVRQMAEFPYCAEAMIQWFVLSDERSTVV
jgi:hypothetical protein